MIRLDSVSKDYGDHPGVIAGLDLLVGDGELLFVEGSTGAGKSTLCRLLAGVDAPTRGRIAIGGHDLTGLSRRALAYLRQRMGLVFQDDRFVEAASALENVILPLDIAGSPRRDAVRRGKAALDRLGLLAREAARPAALSGGERRRLAIARAIVNQPALLLADAPFEGLDADDAGTVAQLLEDFRATGCTVLITGRTAPEYLSRGHGQTRIARLAQGRLTR